MSARDDGEYEDGEYEEWEDADEYDQAAYDDRYADGDDGYGDEQGDYDEDQGDYGDEYVDDQGGYGDERDVDEYGGAGSSDGGDGDVGTGEGDTDEIIKEGWLTKANPRGKYWKRRWCVLTYDEFRYYTSAEKRDRHRKGQFSLEGAEVSEGWQLEHEPSTPHVLTISVTGRDYYLCCPSDEVLGQWLDALQLALGYDDEEDEYGDAGAVGDDDMYIQDPDEDDAFDDEGQQEEEEEEEEDEAEGQEAAGDDDGAAQDPDGGDGDEAEEAKGADAQTEDGNSNAGGASAAAPGSATGSDAASDGEEAMEGTEDGEPDAGVSEARGDGDDAMPAASASSSTSRRKRHRRHRHGHHSSRRKKPAQDPASTATDVTSQPVREPVGEPVGGPVGRASGDGAAADSAAGAAPPAQSAMELSTLSAASMVGLVQFQVEDESGKVWTIVAKEGKAARMTVGKIKRYIAKHSEPPLRREAMTLLIEDEVLLDEWTGADIGLTDGTTIRLIANAEPESTPPAPPPSAQATAAPPTPVADTVAPTPRPVMSPSPASRADGAAAAAVAVDLVEARLRWRQVFQAAAAGSHVAQHDALHRHAMADPRCADYLARHTDVARSLQSAGSTTWAAFSKLLRSATPGAATPAAAVAQGLQPQVATPATAAGSAATPASAASATSTAVVPQDTPCTMLLTVALDEDGGTGDIAVSPDADPDALTNAFIQEKGMDAQAFFEPLRAEVVSTLADVRAMEIQRLTKQLSAARHAAAAASTAVSPPILPLPGAQDPALAEQLRVAQERLAEADARTAKLELRVKQQEDVLQRATFNRYVRGNGAAAAAQDSTATAEEAAVAAEFDAADRDHDGQLSRQEYREWARQKAAILKKANDDRAKLTRENARLRALLHPSANATEGKFQALDEERVRLEAEVDSLTTTTTKLEAELKSVYRRWEEDGHRWAVERRRLQDQLRAHADAAAALVTAPAAAVAAATNSTAAAPQQAGTGRSAKEFDALLRERDLILKNWSEETEILVTIWKQDKAAWAKEKEQLQKQLAASLR